MYRQGRRVQEWGRLMRLDKPVGIWLLLWPELWALWIAGGGRPEPRVLVIFLLGTVVMRSAGCVINDFADRNVDPYVKRTKDRPLAARRVGPREALVLFFGLACIALYLALQLDIKTLKLAIVGAVLTVSYPFLKRFFPLPQFYLGLAFGWAVPMAYMAASGSLPRVAWVLFVTAVLWACIYDTLYAMVDREDDVKIGVKSSAVLFADMDKLIVAIMQAMMLFALILVGRAMKFGNWYLTGVIAAAVFFLYQQWLIRDREPSRCFRAFQNNQYVGLSVFIGVLLEYVYASPS
ncbi:MAG: 4-hydroxybenzoate octaprenyltransferase [Gammaproteobacteria bacterium]